MSNASEIVKNVACDPWRISNRPLNEQLRFGLLRLETNVFCGRSLADSVIRVELGSARERFGVTDAAREVGNSIWAFALQLNTHLLDNGPATLRFLIEFPDGAEAHLPDLTLNVHNTGVLASDVAEALRGHGTPLLFTGAVDSAQFPLDSDLGRPWFDNPEAIAEAAEEPLSFEPARDAEGARRHMVRWGFAILPEVLPDDIIDSFNQAARKAVEEGHLAWRQGSSDRIHGAHLLPEGRAIWLYPPVLDFLRAWFRDEPCACQTLYYINGSEQNPHQDTIHLTPYPQGYMCGVWVPLEDVQANSGELFVYPGSHRTPRLMSGQLGLDKVKNDYSSYVRFDAEIRRLVDEGGYERLVYRPKRGQILVWHENLIHGGSVRIDPAIMRRSIVSHYFARGCVAFYDSRGEAAALESLT